MELSEQLNQALQWASTEAVLQFLKEVLDEPFAGHPQPPFPDGGFRYAHLYGLVGLLNDGRGQAWGKIFKGRHCVGDRGVALYLWLFYIHGGTTEKLVPLNSVTRCDVTNALRIWAEGSAHEYRKRISGCEAEMRRSRHPCLWEAKLDAARSQALAVFSPVRLKATGAGAPGPTPPPPQHTPPSNEQDLNTARLHAFALGTHDRLGFGYSSRQEPCGVRLVAGHTDVLSMIARLVRGLPPRTLAPPIPEVVRLRALNIQLEQERHCFRDALDEANTRLSSAEKSERHALIQREALAYSQAESMIAVITKHCDDRIETIVKEHQAQVKKLKKELRQEKLEHKETQIDAQLLERRLYNEGTDRVRATVTEFRRQIQEAKDARDTAWLQAAARGETAAELEAAIARLRCTSKAGLLEQVASQRETIRKLSERRKSNQRKLQDAALDRRRAHVAQEQQRKCQIALADYCLNDEAQSQQAARATELEKKVSDLEAKLKEQTCQRERFQSIAEPRREYFFNGGSYSIEHDLAGLEAITHCHVCPGQLPKLFFIFARFFRIKLPTYTLIIPMDDVAETVC